ncbi:MAG: selenide, water dikinase SelD [Pararhodobacter sp.]|nr:selenide, water dikinase SelD [Pararhodobacter sp.]
MQTLPLTRDLVLIGGGHAHALVLLRWAMAPLAGARLTLIDPNPVAPYTGMLPGLIAGHYPRAALEMDLVRLARHAGARLVLGRAEGLDLASGHVHVAGRPPLGFDVASLDIGISSDLPALPGFAAHGVAAKPLGGYAARWEAFVAEVEAGRQRPEIAIIGAGVGGVELALAMAHRLHGAPGLKIALIERGNEALPHAGGPARRRLVAHLVRAGVSLITGAEPAEVTPEALILADGRSLPARLVLGAAGSRPQGWLEGTGLKLSEGYITVDATLRAHADPPVFAAGDCAHMAHAPRPKAGVFAVRQAPVLAHNLRAALSGGRLRTYRPQRDYLKLVSLGCRAALADKWGMALEGRWLWRVKDRIDRRFMRMFHALPVMPPPALPRPAALGLAEALGEKPLCGGCGAKLGPGLLREALAGLPAPSGDVALGAGDDAAVLSVGGARQVIATDHLRAFTEDPFVMARIATLHALGDIWAMGATPQAALVNVTLPRQSEALAARMLGEIMQGVSTALAGAGAALAGGHSAMGAELSIGVTVTGLAGKRLLTKGGAQAGEALVLTRPLGSGTLLAAEMARQANGRDIAALWALLARPQGDAAALVAADAGAMTDVTGFGLAGHLDEMLRASGVHARLDLAAIPLLQGAEALAARGVASSVAPANRAALIGRIAAPDTPRAAMLLDPQTAGGFLASLPADRAEALCAELRYLGHEAAVIGQLLPEGEGPAIRC